jgi:hypothetical protein
MIHRKRELEIEAAFVSSDRVGMEPPVSGFELPVRARERKMEKKKKEKTM